MGVFQEPIPCPDGYGWLKVADPSGGILQWLSFSLLRLESGSDYEGAAEGETVAVVMFGTVTVESDGHLWSPVRGRTDVFSGKAAAFYFRSEARFHIRSHTECEMAFFSSPAPPFGECRFIAPDQVTRRSAGRFNWFREIDDIVPSTFAAKRLLVGETRNPPGNWSSFPPHRHQEHRPPREAALEEVYHFRVRPKSGFAVQILMDESETQAFVVRDGDTVLIPRGFHPVVAAPGCQVYYLWCLAGEGRDLYIFTHPDFEWIASVEALPLP